MRKIINPILHLAVWLLGLVLLAVATPFLAAVLAYIVAVRLPYDLARLTISEARNAGGRRNKRGTSTK
jgi:hypothetical protein